MKPTYKELQKQLTESRREFTAANATIHSLELKVAQVVAENAGLMKFGETLFLMHAGLNGSGTGIQGEHEVACQQVALDAAMDEFGEIKTPATDAAIANIQVQGVDIARNAMIDFVEGEIGPNENVPGLIRAAEICVSIAAQLRQGAKHE